MNPQITPITQISGNVTIGYLRCMRPPIFRYLLAGLFLMSLQGCLFRHTDLPYGGLKSGDVWLKGFEPDAERSQVIVLVGVNRSSAWTIHRVEAARRNGIVLVRGFLDAQGPVVPESKVYTDGYHLHVPIAITPDIQAIAWGRWDNLIWTRERGSLLVDQA